MPPFGARDERYHGEMRRFLLSCVFLTGCGGMVETTPQDASSDAAVDTGFALDTAPPVLDTATPPFDGPGPRGAFFVHEVSSTKTRDITVGEKCDVLLDGASLGRATDAACEEFWRAVYDVAAGTDGPCPTSSDLTYTLQLNSSGGPTYHKTEKDYCLRRLPGIGSHKAAYVLVYALGGK